MRSSARSALAGAANDLGFRLLELLAGPNGNVLLSPLSASLALGMAAQGARGKTWEAMVRGLGLEGMSPEAAREEATRLTATLEATGEGVALELANSCWAADGFPLRPDFVEAMRACYGAELANLDFGSPQAAATINRWTGEKTHGKVLRIVERLDPRDVLYLLNATYFRGDWAIPFPGERTEDRPFTTADRSAVATPMMARRGTFDYAEDSVAQAVSLPYQGGRFHLLVVLPRSLAGPAELGRLATPTWWQARLDALRAREGEVLLPRFQLDLDTALGPPLAELGLAPAFRPGADFSGFSAACGERCLLSEVRQRVVIEVDEQGTTAAAATIAGVRMLSVRMTPELPFRMVVDRPFLFGLGDRATGALLFLGVCADPTNPPAAA